jgi:hypothetical protein
LKRLSENGIYPPNVNLIGNHDKQTHLFIQTQCL